jgi:hypothetical protein
VHPPDIDRLRRPRLRLLSVNGTGLVGLCFLLHHCPFPKVDVGVPPACVWRCWRGSGRDVLRLHLPLGHALVPPTPRPEVAVHLLVHGEGVVGGEARQGCPSATSAAWACACAVVTASSPRWTSASRRRVFVGVGGEAAEPAFGCICRQGMGLCRRHGAIAKVDVGITPASV